MTAAARMWRRLSAMTEQAAVDRWEQRAEWPLAIVAVVFLAVYSIRVLGQPQGITAHIIDALTAASWLVFAVDYIVRLWLAPDRQDWFLRHLLGLAIVAFPLLQPLRLVPLVVLVGALERAVGGAIHGRVIVYTITSAALLVYVASLAELQAERHNAHATINSFGKAVWWSITTITTVGYGNEYPITATGRVIAAVLMICGISVLGMITASIASWMIRYVGDDGPAGRAPTGADFAELRGEINALRRQLSGGADTLNP